MCFKAGVGDSGKLVTILNAWVYNFLITHAADVVYIQRWGYRSSCFLRVGEYCRPRGTRYRRVIHQFKDHPIVDLPPALGEPLDRVGNIYGERCSMAITCQVYAGARREGGMDYPRRLVVEGNDIFLPVRTRLENRDCGYASCC